MPRRQRSEADLGGRGLFKQWEALHTSPPATLYHYTTAQGLLSMVKSGHIWATESRYMNDPREFVHGAEVLLWVIDRLLARKNPLKALFEVREQVAATRHGEAAERPHFLRVVSAREGDLLSQWRGYGDSGGGYALGFQPTFCVRTQTARTSAIATAASSVVRATAAGALGRSDGVRRSARARLREQHRALLAVLQRSDHLVQGCRLRRGRRVAAGAIRPRVVVEGRVAAPGPIPRAKGADRSVRRHRPVTIDGRVRGKASDLRDRPRPDARSGAIGQGASAVRRTVRLSGRSNQAASIGRALQQMIDIACRGAPLDRACGPHARARPRTADNQRLSPPG